VYFTSLKETIFGFGGGTAASVATAIYIDPT
jgi:hypothetical protein